MSCHESTIRAKESKVTNDNERQLTAEGRRSVRTGFVGITMLVMPHVEKKKGLLELLFAVLDLRMETRVPLRPVLDQDAEQRTGMANYMVFPPTGLLGLHPFAIECSGSKLIDYCQCDSQ
jgi:hypothetical protein